MSKKEFSSKLSSGAKVAAGVALLIACALLASWGDTISGVNPPPSHERVQD